MTNTTENTVEVTKVETGAATTPRGKRAGRATKKALGIKAAPKTSGKRKSPSKIAATKAPAKAPATKAKAGNTFTSVDIAAEQGISAKTLRARIRRNLDKWEPLFKDGEKHVFADNKTTRAKVQALLES